jgi:predicted outer membrane repeat protein
MLSTLLCLLLSSLAFAQIYVDQSATAGTNDGTSWEDAYTDLQDALANAAPNDEIWVAQGTYTPDTMNGSTLSTFLIDKDIAVLGGFSGNGDERDPDLYLTILSGDLNGDDLDDNTGFKSDNVYTIVTVAANVTNAALLDGFTLNYGWAFGAIDNPQQNGGAIYTSGDIRIKSCRFTQNHAFEDGGAVFVQGSAAEGISFENCFFEKNKAIQANSLGGALAAQNVPGAGVQVLNSTFLNNEGGWGGAIHLERSSGFFDGVNVSFNVTARQAGGIRFYSNFPDRSLTIQNSVFEGNTGAFGGAVYVLAVDNASNTEIVIQNSDFVKNAAAPVLSGWGSGGAGVGVYVDIPIENALVLIDECNFDENSSVGAGTAFLITDEGTMSDVRIHNSVFLKNSSQSGAGAIWTVITGANGNYEMKGSLVTQNTTSGEGTVSFWATAGATGSVLVDSCTFENNTADYGSGLEMGAGWNGGVTDMEFRAQYCEFRNNESMEGGGLLLWTEPLSSAQFEIENCTIDGNTGSLIGGGISFILVGPGSSANVKNTYITNNQSPKGAAMFFYPYFPDAPFPEDVSISFENCLISDNEGGSAISIDSLPNLHLLNCTVAGNIGGGIGLENKSGLTLQNTILYNPGYPDFVDVTNDGSAVSNQGNLIFDNSLDAILQPLDKTGIDPGFMPGTYEPAAGSPLVNAGINGGVTAQYDIAGNDRIKGGFVDIGAYESDLNLSAKNLLGAAESLALSPNPATESVFATLPDEFSFPGLAEIIDASGNTVSRPAFVPGSPIAVGELPAGMYTLKITGEGRVYTGRFVKQ